MIMRLNITRVICTTVMKGALDEEDGVFEKIVDVYKNNFADLDKCYNEYSHNNMGHCTHLRSHLNIMTTFTPSLCYPS